MSQIVKAERLDVNQYTDEVKESLRLIEDLKFFLATAPANWQENQVIRRYYLNSDEGFVSCVFWNNLYFITGTDIVRCIVYKFTHFGRKIIDRKKFEEGIFSDLRNLKRDTDAVLEAPRSEFLRFLYKNSCLRTQKKQKVFFWFNVPHDKLMADALERDLKKEKMGQQPTTVAEREPAISFTFDESLLLELDFSRQMGSDPIDSELGPTKEDELPDYKSSAAAIQNEAQDQLGTMVTTVHHDVRNSDEDDFPLDYFPAELYSSRIPNDDYIPVDKVQPGYSVAFDEVVRAYNFSVPQSAVRNGAAKDGYLIEQTQPAKSNSKMYQVDSHAAPKQIVYGAPSATIPPGDYDDSYGAHLVAPPSSYQHFYDPGMSNSVQYPPYMVPFPEPYVYNPYGEQEPWSVPYSHTPFVSLPMYKEPTQDQMFQPVYEQPAMVAVHPGYHQVSEKQRAASTNMMRKKKELSSRVGGIRKPPLTPKVRFFTANADSPRVSDSDQFIPTPESSIPNAE